MKIGICKLCKNEKQLRNSHVVPRSVFKRALKGFNHGVVLDLKYNKVVNTQDQWATYLLCADCEHKLNIRYEEYSLAALRDEVRGVRHQEKQGYLQIVNINQHRLILFVLSILWRALESDHKVFKKINDLGVSEEVKEHYRSIIYNNILPRPQVFTVRISKLVTVIDEFKDLELNFITNFGFDADTSGFVRSLIIMDGYCFEIFLHTSPSSRLEGLGILKSQKKILKIPRIEAFSIPELKQSLGKMIEAEKK